MNAHFAKLARLLAVFVLALPALAPASGFSASGVDSFTLTLQSPPLEDEKSLSEGAPFSIPGYGPLALPGDPLLPARIVSVAVPPDIDWSTLKVEVTQAKTEDLPGAQSFPPAGPAITWDEGQEIIEWGPNAAHIQDGKNRLVYDSDAFFPASPVELLGTSQMRKWRFIRVAYTPLQFNPVSGQVRFNPEVLVQVSFRRLEVRPQSAELADTLMDERASNLFENFSQAQAWYRLAGALSEAQSLQQKPGYAVITTNEIAAGSTLLAEFLAHQEALGREAFLVTETDYGGLVGQPPNTRAEKIRQWLVQNYLTLNLQYVLLIGNPDPYDPSEPAGSVGDVPMQMTWPRADYYHEAPTDYFYADLTGNWDLDGNGYFGEYPDDSGPGGVDFASDVYVGRIPVYSAISGWQTKLNSILRKTIDYYGSPAAFRKKALLANSFLSDTFDSANITEGMRDNFLTSFGFSSYRMYQNLEGPICNSIYDPEEPLLHYNMSDHWANYSYGIVTWNGHGSWSGTSLSCSQGVLISRDNNVSLSDDTPAFTFQASCENGLPEQAGNAGTAFLEKGAVGTVSASRVSWYTGWDTPNTYYADNANLQYHYVYHLSSGEPAGQSLYDMKSLMDGYSASFWWMNLMVYNLYGDPSVRLTSPSAVTVTNTADSGPGSLRWAIQQVADGGEINFDLPLPATITLTSGELGITKRLLIDGPGPDRLTISGQGTNRAFHTNAQQVIIRDLQIQDGRSPQGGAIYNSKNLELISVRLTGNHAQPFDFGGPEAFGGAIYNTGSLYITGSQISGNDASSSDMAYGGGIANFGILTVAFTTISQNNATGWHNYGGAGIYNEGTLFLENSALESNAAEGQYGGYGGGLLNYGTADLTNCTLSANTIDTGSSGGAIHNDGTLYLRNCTVAQNSAYLTGGISGSATLFNTIVAYNEAANGGNCGSAVITSSGHNLDNDGTCELDGLGDLSQVDPLLGGLSGDAYRPRFHPLLTGSPAVDAGDDYYCPWSDQREVPRPQGAGCDMGAYEAVQIVISDGQVLEGNDGESEIQFQVEASGFSDEQISIEVAIESGSAQAGLDYSPISGTLPLPIFGEPGAMLTVPIVADLIDEPDETFTVTLSNAYSGVIMNGAAQGLIIDDDTSALALADVALPEVDAPVQVVFTMTLDLLNALPVQVDWATADGTALANHDYTAGSGMLTFPPGSISQTFTVQVLGDDRVEPDETFTIKLSHPQNADLPVAEVLVTLQDDDQAAISIEGVEQEEGAGEMIFPVRLSQPLSQTVTVDFATADDSALAGSDYQPISGTLSFSPGTADLEVQVVLIDDGLPEPTENFWLDFSNSIDATLVYTQAAGTILDDDAFWLHLPVLLRREGLGK